MLLKRSHDQDILVLALILKAEFDINEDLQASHFYVLS